MCCLFTCCSWLLDGVQRCWSFSMACLIGLAICCAFIIASAAGVALGYNYSIAEYVELKETNVSVFMKRGVFDDTVVDEMDWRRGGGGVANIMKDAEETAEAQARRSAELDAPMNDEGIFATASSEAPNPMYSFESNDHLRYEGALLKLTAKTSNPLILSTTEDPMMAKMFNGYSKDNSFEQLNAIQNLISRRKMDDSLPFDNTWNFANPVNPTAGTFTTLSDSDQLKALQDLINQKKMLALKMASVAHTSRQTTQYTGVDSSDAQFLQARRMGGPVPQFSGNVFTSDYKDIKEMLNPEAPKWYTPRAQDSAKSAPREPLSPDKIVIPNELPKPIIIKATSLMSQEDFRRAMQDTQTFSTITKSQITTVGETTGHSRTDIDLPAPTRTVLLPNIDSDVDFKLQEKEYEEEDIKGTPVRRRKRDKRLVMGSGERVATTIGIPAFKDDNNILLTIKSNNIKTHDLTNDHIDISLHMKEESYGTTTYLATELSKDMFPIVSREIIDRKTVSSTPSTEEFVKSSKTMGSAITRTIFALFQSNKTNTDPKLKGPENNNTLFTTQSENIRTDNLSM